MARQLYFPLIYFQFSLLTYVGCSIICYCIIHTYQTIKKSQIKKTKSIMFRFGNAQKTSGKLDQMLDKPNLTVQQLFSIENIIGDIKQKVEVFVEYCKKHKQFTHRIIELALNTSLKELQQKKLKKVAFVATEFLSCDQDSLGQLFFGEKEQQKQTKKSEGLKNQSEISERIQQGDSQSNDLTKNQDESSLEQVQQSKEKVLDIGQKKIDDCKSQQEQEKPIFQKYELVKQSLGILQNPLKNQTCLGYISKLYAFLIRREPNAPMQFFSTHKQYTDLLFKNIHYDSIASLIAQILACEDRDREYKYEQYKKKLFQSVIDIMIEKMGEQNIFDGVITLVEQVLNNTKQSYYEYFEDFKRCADVLVSEKVLQKVFNLLQESCEAKQPSDLIIFKNATTYLHMIAKRINADSDDTDYYETNDKKQPTMTFQIDFLYKKIDELIQTISKVEKQGLLAKNLYLSLIVELTKNIKFKDFPFNFVKNFQIELNCLKKWENKGIIKNSLFQIIDLSISRAQTQQILSLFQNKSDMLKQFFGFLSERTTPETAEECRIVNELRENNKNQTICYFFKIFFMLKNRQSQKLAALVKQIGINVQETEQKYQTKLASPLKESSDFRIFSKSELQISKNTNNEKEAQFLSQAPINQSPVVFDFNNDRQNNNIFANRTNMFIPPLNIPHTSSGSSNSSGKDSPPALELHEKKQSDIIIDIDTKGVIIQHEEVQRLVINSPRRGNLIGGFMGASSPRNISLSGFKSDRSSQGNNSARSKQQQPSIDTIKQEIKEQNKKQQKPKIIRNFSAEEVQFYVRHAILI